MTERASIFKSAEDFDVSEFAPKHDKPIPPAPAEAIRAVAEKSNFKSREPAAPRKVEKEQPAKREPRRYRTGRNIQLSIKVSSETAESFYRLADEHGWVLGETLERALEALTRAQSREG